MPLSTIDSLFYQLGKLSAPSSSSSSSGAERVDNDPGRLSWWLAPLAVAAIVFDLVVVAFPVTPLTLVDYVVLALAVAMVYDAVGIVQAYEKRTLTALGDYKDTPEPGLNVVLPFISKAYHLDMRIQTLDVPSQEAITKDNSLVTTNAVVYICMMDPERVFLQVDNRRRVVSLLTQTTPRATLDDMGLDSALAHHGHINARIRRELDEPTDEWDTRVESAEVREVKPSKDVKNAVEQQASAERRRRTMILEAQGERRSAVEKAEGDKQSNIIRAQSERQSQILEVQGDAIPTVPWARAAESMGECAIIDEDTEALVNIGTLPSTTYVLPQELTSPLDCYGKELSGSDVQQAARLKSKVFDEETRELFSLDDTGEILGELGGVETVDISTDTIDIEIENDGAERAKIEGANQLETCPTHRGPVQRRVWFAGAIGASPVV